MRVAGASNGEAKPVRTITLPPAFREFLLASNGRFPDLADELRELSGIDVEYQTGELPVLGPVEGLDGYWNATGGFRTGIVAAPLVGRVVAESLCGLPTAHSLEPYRADRFAATDARGS